MAGKAGRFVLIEQLQADGIRCMFGPYLIDLLLEGEVPSAHEATGRADHEGRHARRHPGSVTKTAVASPLIE